MKTHSTGYKTSLRLTNYTCLDYFAYICLHCLDQPVENAIENTKQKKTIKESYLDNLISKKRSFKYQPVIFYDNV